MSISRDDCISITDATFDLTLEDSSPLKALPETNTILEDHHLHNNTISIAVEPPVDPATVNQIDREESKTLNLNRHSDLLNESELRENSTSYKSSLQNLKKSIATLSKVCGNCNVTDNSGPLDINHVDHEVEKLSDIVAQLSENCSLKLTFYENNYKFVEGLHETSNKENQMLKQKVHSKEHELRELESKYGRLKKEYLKNLEASEERGAAETLNQQSKDAQQLRNPPNYDIESHQIILKQQKEIKEYKRFIKELMERD